MPNWLAGAMIGLALSLTIIGKPAEGIVVLGTIIAINGQKWKK